jgi:fructose-specific PTS system IIA-like component
MPLEFAFVFPLKNGMHARPASLLQDVANAYRSSVTFVNRQTGGTANGKSTLSLVGSITRQGDPCAVIVEGEDEGAAYEALRRFLTDVFPECDEELEVPSAVPGAARSLPRALRGEQLRVDVGTPVSKGIARAPAAVLSRHSLEPPPGGWAKETDDAEVSRVIGGLRDVQAKMRAQLATMKEGVEQAILKAHLSIAGDPDFAVRVEEIIRQRHCSAGEALIGATGQYAELLAQSESLYLQERILDIHDVAAQLLRWMYGGASTEKPPQLAGDAICVAENLPPSQFIALDKRRVRGLALAHGGATSHTVILARSFGIPCVTGIADVHRIVSPAEDVILDADRGFLIRTPSERVSRFYERETRTRERLRARLRRFADLPGVSADGRKLEIAANAASPAEVGAAIAHGAEGIGLFRTEMLFMDRAEPPGEEEQYRIYAEAAKNAGARSVIIRTLDIGGDKPIAYLNLPPEENPFLGYRATRLYDDHPQLINTQLRAILRASASGNLKVMVPMICSVQEVRAIKARIQELMRELDAEGVVYDARIPVGIMVEIPSVAFVIDQLCQEVDFFSIGSNDLTQYFLAVDRANARVSSLYTPFHPSFLRLLKQIVDEVHERGKWVGLCGEMGGNSLATPLFVGYGIDEISLAPSLIPAVKEVLCRCRVPECEALLSSVLQMDGPGDVEGALKEFAASQRAEGLVAPELVDLSSQATSKEEAIRELVDLLHGAGRVDDPDMVEEAVWAREETYPTGMGFGVAIPHCKSPHVTVSSIAVLKLTTPVPWKAPDEDPVRFLILIAISAAARGDQHLRIIASLARKLMHEEFRQELTDATSPDSVVRLLEQHLPM